MSQKNSGANVIIGVILGAILVVGTLYIATDGAIFGQEREVSIELKAPNLPGS